MAIVVLSFSYENQIITVSSYDRLNPRLFDLVVLIGLMFIFPKYLLYIKKTDFYIKIWIILVIWFLLCALIWGVFLLPKELGAFSIHRALKYMQGLVPITIFNLKNINISEKRILRLSMIWSGILLSLYSVFEYTGLFGIIENDGILGPFKESYFQLSQTAPVYFSLCYYSYAFENSIRKKIALIIISFLIIVPLFLSGSRTGIAYVVIIVIVSIIYKKDIWKSFLIYLLISFIAAIFLHYYSGIDIKNAPTLSRIEQLERKVDKTDNIISRLSYPLTFSPNKYEAGNLLFLIGAGFNVATADLGFGYFRPRIDYGFHSMYLFPLEQAGILGLILFIIFLFCIIKKYHIEKKRVLIKEDLIFNGAGFAYFISMLFIGIGGHNFWQGFASGNVNTLILIFMIISLKIKKKTAGVQDSSQIALRNESS